MLGIAAPGAVRGWPVLRERGFPRNPRPHLLRHLLPAADKMSGSIVAQRFSSLLIRKSIRRVCSGPARFAGGSRIARLRAAMEFGFHAGWDLLGQFDLACSTHISPAVGAKVRGQILRLSSDDLRMS